jgi:putative heme degradation protein
MPDHSSSKEEMASPRKKRKKIQFSDDYGENIDKVHQDEDYSKSVESYLNSTESNSENLQLF